MTEKFDKEKLIKNIVKCDKCKMPIHISRAKFLQGYGDLCPNCYEQLFKVPKTTEIEITESKGEVDAIDQNWLDSLIMHVHEIWIHLAKETFERYRECGKLILYSGYAKGKWHSEHRQYFLDNLQISQPTLSRMVILGKMSDEEFIRATNKFASFDAWTHQKALAKEERRERQIAILKEATKTLEPPQQKFDVIVVDPPWNVTDEYDPDFRRGALPYPRMTTDEIMDINLPATENCVLWLWTTNAFLHEAYHVIASWGFQPKSVLTWVKQKFGLGVWLRGQTEHCILATRGQPTIKLTDQSTALFADAHEHSSKPDEFYALVDSLCPGWKLDYFGRKKREGWEVFGTLENNQ